MLSLSSRAIRETIACAQVLPNDVAPQRQRQPRLLEPPLPQVDHLVKTLVPVIELTFVNQKPRVDASFSHRRQDLVERHHRDRHILAQAELERQVSRRELARNRDRLPLRSSSVIGSRVTSVGP